MEISVNHFELNELKLVAKVEGQMWGNGHSRFGVEKYAKQEVI